MSIRTQRVWRAYRRTPFEKFLLSVGGKWLHFLWYTVIAAVLTNFALILVHEMSHGFGNFVTGGTLSWGNISFMQTFGGVLPSFYIMYDEMGNPFWATLAGPLIAILIGWTIAILYRPKTVGGNTSERQWLRRRGIVYGGLLRSFSDGIYLAFVVDGGIEWGDGAGIHHYFENLGWGWERTVHVFGTTIPVDLNPQYLIAGFLLVATLVIARYTVVEWVAYRFWKDRAGDSRWC